MENPGGAVIHQLRLSATLPALPRELYVRKIFAANRWQALGRLWWPAHPRMSSTADRYSFHVARPFGRKNLAAFSIPQGVPVTPSTTIKRHAIFSRKVRNVHGLAKEVSW